MSSAACSRNSFRFLGRSFLALVFTPEPPFNEWLEELDSWLARSTGFFAEKPVVLDLSRITLTQLDYIGLMTELEIRKIRIISVEGVDPDWRDPSHAPIGNGGRSGNVIEFPEPPAAEGAADNTNRQSDKQTGSSDAPEANDSGTPSQRSGHEAATRQASADAVTEETRSRGFGTGAATTDVPLQPQPAQPPEAVQRDAPPEQTVPAAHTASVSPTERIVDFTPTPETSSLLLESSVRSGQSVVFPSGDVTVIGSIASGAEVVAGGSIHVYGALRGRAIAGANGNPKARIFCAQLQAELLAIDGLYKTADDMEPDLRNQPVQAWLEGEVMMLKSQD